MKTILSTKIDWLTWTKIFPDNVEGYPANTISAEHIARRTWEGFARFEPEFELLRSERFYPWVFAEKITGAEIAVGKSLSKQGVRATWTGSKLPGLRDADMLCDALKADEWRLTRVDVCVDVVGYEMDWDALELAMKTAARAKRRAHHPYEKGEARTIYQGKRTSDGMMRVYNKAVQQKVDYLWTRVEMEIKGHVARAIGDMQGNVWRNSMAHMLGWSEAIDAPIFDLVREYAAVEPDLVKIGRRVVGERERWFDNTVRSALIKWFSEDGDAAYGWLDKMSTMLDIFSGKE